LELGSSPEVPAKAPNGPTVVELFALYVRHATDYYGPGAELEAIKSAVKIVRQHYGDDAVADFGPKKLAAVRQAFIEKGWARTYVNRQVGKVVRAFKWAAGEEIVPSAAHLSLKSLAPLRRGHCDAPESEPRRPANPEHVAAALPFLPPHVRAIIELLRCTGMRPGEACAMTVGDIDRTESPWTYRPVRHKSEHRGHDRAVSLGKQAQAVIEAHTEGRAFADADPLFSPHRQREERFARLRAARKSKVQPSQQSRKNAAPTRAPGLWFNSHAISSAVAKACEKAGVPKWSPYQLRHLKGAELRCQFPLEHVRAALGHTHASMTAHYAKGADRKLAAEVAMAVG